MVLLTAMIACGVIFYQFNHFFYVACIEIVLHRVVVGGGSYHDKISVAVGLRSIERDGQVQLLFRQVLFDVIVLYGRLTLVNQVYLLGYHVNSRHLVALAEKGGYTKSYVAGSGHGNLDVFSIMNACGLSWEDLCYI